MPPFPAAARRHALIALFFLPGVVVASWVTRTPAIRDRLEVSTAQMGLVILGLSVGAMLGITSSAPLVARLGTRQVMAAGLLLTCLSLLVMAAGAWAGSPALMTAGLFCCGLGLGSADVALNIEGAEVEREAGRPLMAALHGFFSLGTLAGALAGIALTAGEVPVTLHLAAMGLLCLPVLALALARIPPGTGRRMAGSAGRRPGGLWRDRRLQRIGLIILGLALAEGAANDWLPLLMVDGHGVDEAAGSLVFAGFAAAMTAGRFGGNRLLARYGRVRVLRASAASASLGLLLVILGDSPWAAGAGVVLWGLGASLGFPVAISAAADTGPAGSATEGADAAARVGLVATAGYIAFLVGPPLLGFVGEAAGLRSAMVIVLAAVAMALVLAPALAPPPAPRR